MASRRPTPCTSGHSSSPRTGHAPAREVRRRRRVDRRGRRLLRRRAVASIEKPRSSSLPRIRNGPSRAGSDPSSSGRRGHQVLPGDREVQRQVVPDQAPAPVAVGLRLVEERQEVALRVAEVGGHVAEHRLVELAEHVLERHHLDDLRVPLDRHALRDQPVREVALGAGSCRAAARRGDRTRAGSSSGCGCRRPAVRPPGPAARRRGGRTAPWRRRSPGSALKSPGTERWAGGCCSADRVLRQVRGLALMLTGRPSVGFGRSAGSRACWPGGWSGSRRYASCRA